MDPRHSLSTDPTVLQLRAAAQLLGDDIWIAVKLPGADEGDDDLDDDAAIRRWTPVDHRGALPRRTRLATRSLGPQREDSDDTDDDEDDVETLN